MTRTPDFISIPGGWRSVARDPLCIALQPHHPMKLASENSPMSSEMETLRVELTSGLIGLAHLRQFEISSIDGSWPFVSMRSLGEEEINFLALEPQNAIPAYDIEVSDADAEALNLVNAEDAIVFNIVTVHSTQPQFVTVNLIGPVVLNRHTLVGRQVILANSDQFSAKHVLIDERGGTLLA
jgi:flagellar assembly factor FliW